MTDADQQSESETETEQSSADHAAPPHDSTSSEPLGPLTPDDETPMGDTPEAHDEISPHDLPPDHPGRQEAERMAGGPDGVTRGNQ
jgi:hypothetical protein